MVCTILIEMFSMLVMRQVAPTPPAVPLDAAFLEVAGSFDAFLSLEDFAPDLSWREALAAAWGLPYVEEEND